MTFAEEYTDMRTARVRTFDTGATRSPDQDKPEYAGYLSPLVVYEFGQYMMKHQIQTDGTRRDSRNWQKGIPLESYMQSMWRHFMSVWMGYEATRHGGNPQAMVDDLMALLFNVQGMAHEIIKEESC